MLPLHTKRSIGAAREPVSGLGIVVVCFEAKGRESVAKNGAHDETGAKLPEF